MAGSLSHIVGRDGTFRMDLIENMGDAREALEECFEIIYGLAKGNTSEISKVCKRLGYPDPWNNEYGDNPKLPMKSSGRIKWKSR